MRKLSLSVVLVIMLAFLILLVITSDRLFQDFSHNQPHQEAAGIEPQVELQKDYFSESLSEIISSHLEIEGNDCEIAALALWITSDSENDYDRLVAIYDWITSNIAYDLKKADNMSAYDSGALYLLQTGQGVCHDYAELAKRLLQAVGIESTYERGEVRISEAETELHAWNQALVNNKWYALDTTWGAGYIMEESAEFIQNPRRIYLTTPEELEKLHNNIAYKQEKEQAYWQETILAAPPTSLPEMEYNLRLRFNDYRHSKGLNELVEEHSLTSLARQNAEIITETLFLGDDSRLGDITSSVQERMQDLRIRSVSIVPFIKIVNRSEVNQDIIKQVLQEQTINLKQERWDAIAIGAISREELNVFILIYIEYH